MGTYYKTPTRKANILFLKFLLATTVAFLFLVALVYLRQQGQVEQSTQKTVVKEVKFSDLATTSDVIVGYAHDARMVHDFESYPELKSLFFSSRTGFLKDANLQTVGLGKVREVQGKADDFSDSHVYNTSYYIGNLLVLPDVTLYDLLSNNAISNTGVLLESALADVRAGVVKLQNYFDQPTPSQLDNTITTQLFFKTPSFPNLTTAEALTVFYLLALVDSKNARTYEMHAHQYLNQVWMSGGTFEFDIEYAVLLAHEYNKIFKSNKYYSDLIKLAETEFENFPVVKSDLLVEPKFKILDFPYSSEFLISDIKNFNYSITYKNEELSGSIMLSLIDNRLPEPKSSLYQYNFLEGVLLPYALTLSSRNFPELKSGIRMATYLDEERYLLVVEAEKESGPASDSQRSSGVYYYQPGRLSLLKNLEKDSQPRVNSHPDLNLSENSIVWSQESLLNNTIKSQQIFFANLKGGEIEKEEKLTQGSFPNFHSDRQGLIFTRDDGIYYRHLVSGEETRVIKTPLINRGDGTTSFDYDRDSDIAVSKTVVFDKEKSKFISNINLYQVETISEAIEGRLVYKLTLEDSRVQSVVLSPAGRYLAITTSEAQTRKSPRLLIFDLISGIIEKEISLESFSPDSLYIDDWTLFN